jgi:hypothetical protein
VYRNAAPFGGVDVENGVVRSKHAETTKERNEKSKNFLHNILILWVNNSPYNVLPTKVRLFCDMCKYCAIFG